MRPDLPLLLWRSLQQAASPQKQPRIPEATAAIEGEARVSAFHQACEETNLWAIHAFLCDLAQTLAPPAGEALDLACGSGRLIAALGQRLPNYRFHGLDISPEMLALAQADPWLGRERWAQGDMADLSAFEDGRFQLTTWALAAHHADGPDHVVRALREMRRVTHPDGAMIVCDLGRLRTGGLNRWYIEWASQGYSPTLHREFQRSILAAYTTEEWRAMAAEAGLPELAHRPMWGLPTLHLLIDAPTPAPRRLPLTPRRPEWALLPERVRADYETLAQLFERSGVVLKAA